MKNIFTSEFISKLIIEVIIIGLLVFFVQNYFLRQWQPLTAAETLKKENFLNAKRDVYFEAIQIANRQYAYTDFTDSLGNPTTQYNRERGALRPTEFEVNNCFSKLCIYSDNKQITQLFKRFFIPQPSDKPIQNLEMFINLLRSDLGYGNGIINPKTNEYEYIAVRKLDGLKNYKTKTKKK